MRTPYRLKHPLGLGHNANPDDVWATKKTLRAHGYYIEPKYGMTEYPDQHLFDAIKQYQHDNKLSVDGIMTPDGETERHILNQGNAALTYWCSICGAPHGGVYSPNICWQCWNKGYR